MPTGPSPAVLRDEPVCSYERDAWVIPDGHGALWTDQVFATKIHAQDYVNRYWLEAGWQTPKHRPVLARVQLTASIVRVGIRQWDQAQDASDAE